MRTFYVLLISNLLIFAVAGLHGGTLWVIFIGLSTIFYLLFPMARYYTLPKAILEVDGYTVEYRYSRKETSAGTVYRGAVHGLGPTFFYLTRVQKGELLPIVILPFMQAETTTYEARFTLEGVSYDLLMDGGYAHSNYGMRWSGQLYVASFAREESDSSIGGQIVFLAQGGSGRKQRKLKRLKLPKLKWNLFPHPTPSPV